MAGSSWKGANGAATAGDTTIIGHMTGRQLQRRPGYEIDVDGVADFNALHSRNHDHEAQLYCLDVLAIDSDDLRGLLLSIRSTNLARLLVR